MLIRQIFKSTWKPLAGRHVTTGPAAISSPLHYLDGQRVGPNHPNEDLTILEPATGNALCKCSSSGKEEVDRAVDSCKATFNTWSQLSGRQRGKFLWRAAQIVRENQEELARMEVTDTGKPIWEARFDIEGCADTMEYFAGLASTLHGQHVTLPEGSFAYTRREALGVCGGIGAWNYPFQMASWKSAPALACGNTMVFKPSPLTPLTAVMLAEIYTDAGFPQGCFNVVQGGAETGQCLTNHPDIAKMSFTGSVPAGVKVMEACAKGIKHITLELGGKSPLIVFDDADLENAVAGTMMANFLTQGQVCSNGTRVFVHKNIFTPFVERLVARVKRMKIGDPMSEETTVGAMISREQAERVISYIEGAKQQGAKVLCGGEIVTPDSTLTGGHYVSPCILGNVRDDMTIAREEVFGPVACVFDFETEEEVVSRANDTQFGLAGGVFTKNLTRAHKVAAQLQAGSIYINNYNIYPCEVPFGGYKMSGLGRENGVITLEYYTQLKTVFVEAGDVWCPL